MNDHVATFERVKLDELATLLVQATETRYWLGRRMKLDAALRGRLPVAERKRVQYDIENTIAAYERVTMLRRSLWVWLLSVAALNDTALTEGDRRLWTHLRSGLYMVENWDKWGFRPTLPMLDTGTRKIRFADVCFTPPGLSVDGEHQPTLAPAATAVFSRGARPSRPSTAH